MRSYVPIKADYSDLHHAATYFVGLPDGTGSHDDVGKRLGENGARWTAEHWREEDMCATSRSSRCLDQGADAMFDTTGRLISSDSVRHSLRSVKTKLTVHFVRRRPRASTGDVWRRRVPRLCSGR